MRRNMLRGRLCPLAGIGSDDGRSLVWSRVSRRFSDGFSDCFNQRSTS